MNGNIIILLHLFFTFVAFDNWETTGNQHDLLFHVISYTVHAIIYNGAIIFSAFVTFKDVFNLITFHYIWK